MRVLRAGPDRKAREERRITHDLPPLSPFTRREVFWLAAVFVVILSVAVVVTIAITRGG